MLAPELPARAQIPAVTDLTIATAGDRAAAAAELAELLEPIVAMELMGIVGWPGAPGIIVCPEGDLDLPIDVWRCKITNRRCPIQAQVWINDHARFRNGCEAPTATKDGVIAAVESGYRGEHHLPGRYLCPLCPSRYSDRRRYCFPFELYRFPDLLGITNDEDRRGLRELVVGRGFDSRVVSTGICATCFVSALEVLAPPLVAEFLVVEVVSDV